MATATNFFKLDVNGTKLVAGEAADNDNATGKLFMKVKDLLGGVVLEAASTNSGAATIHVGYVTLTVDATAVTGDLTGVALAGGSTETITKGEKTVAYVAKNTGMSLNCAETSFANFYYVEGDVTVTAGRPQEVIRTNITGNTTWTLTDIPAEAE